MIADAGRNVENFASVTQIAICLVAMLTLLSIYLKGYRKDLTDTQIDYDEGIVWMCVACALWCVMGILEIRHTDMAMLHRTLLSLANSVCFVGAAAHLDAYVGLKTPPLVIRFILALQRKRIWFVGVVGLIALTFIVVSSFEDNSTRHYVILDVLISVGTILLLMHGFWKSFWGRKFWILAVLSCAVLAVQLLAQIPELSKVSPEWKAFFNVRPWLKAIDDFSSELRVASKGMVSLLFVALTFTWVYAKSEDRERWRNVTEFPKPAKAPPTIEELTRPVTHRWRGLPPELPVESVTPMEGIEAFWAEPGFPKGASAKAE